MHAEFSCIIIVFYKSITLTGTWVRGDIWSSKCIVHHQRYCFRIEEWTQEWNVILNESDVCYLIVTLNSHLAPCYNFDLHTLPELRYRIRFHSNIQLPNPIPFTLTSNLFCLTFRLVTLRSAFCWGQFRWDTEIWKLWNSQIESAAVMETLCTRTANNELHCKLQVVIFLWSSCYNTTLVSAWKID